MQLIELGEGALEQAKVLKSLSHLELQESKQTARLCAVSARVAHLALVVAAGVNGLAGIGCSFGACGSIKPYMLRWVQLQHLNILLSWRTTHVHPW